MLLWRCLVCVMLAGGVACGLARSDSWQLMVEAGLDGPDRRITPKSVFIAPAVASRSERCRPGFRYDHLGRCVKVVRIDANAQAHLFIKHLQGVQGLKAAPPFVPSASSSNGPLQFSLPIAKVEVSATEPPLTTVPTEPPPTTTTTTTTRTTTTTPEAITVTTTDEDLSTAGQKATTTVSSWDQTIPTLPPIVESSGDGATGCYEGSGEEVTTTTAADEGSGTEPTTEEDRENRSTTESSEESTEMTPIPPNNASAALIYAILRGIDAWKKAESSTAGTPAAMLDNPNNTVLIPLETIELTPQVPLATTPRTLEPEPEPSDFESDSVIRVDSKENKVADNSWVRFPDETPEEASLEITPDENTPKFRFPEEKVDPAQRPAILRFWSSIPMYKEEVAPKSDEQWAAP